MCYPVTRKSTYFYYTTILKRIIEVILSINLRKLRFPANVLACNNCLRSNMHRTFLLVTWIYDKLQVSILPGILRLPVAILATFDFSFLLLI